MSTVVVECPHCGDTIIINTKDINCRIFRHAVYKHNTEPIDPHASKDTCTDLLRRGAIWGCAGPFRLVNKDGVEIPEICDYI